MMSSKSLLQGIVYPPSTASTAYHPRPRSAGSRSSSFLDLSPLPEDVDVNPGLGDVPSVSTSFDSVGAADQQQIQQAPEQDQQPQPQPQPQQQPQEKHEHLNHLEMEKNRRQKLMRPVTAPPQMSASMRAQSPHLRSAKYLASQWRSRATQWSASSSMRNFKDTSSLPSSPPPPLSEHDSDSDSDLDSDSCGGKSATSLESRLSDAHSVVEPWKNRDRTDYSSNNGSDNQSFKTVKTSNTGGAGDDDDDDAYDNAEFSPEDISKSFGFALKVPEKDIDTDQNSERSRQQTAQEHFADYKSLPGDHTTSTSTSLNETHTSMSTHRSLEGMIPPRETTTTTTLSSSSSTNNTTQTHNNPKVQTPDCSDHSPRSVATANSIDIDSSSVTPPQSQDQSQPQPQDQQITRTVEKQKDKLQLLNSTRREKRGMGKATPTPAHATSNSSTKKKSSTTTTTSTNQNHVTKTKTNSNERSPRKRLETPTPTMNTSNSPSSPRPATEPTRWAQYEVIFTFSLLTSPEKAPPIGAYMPDDDIDSISFKEKLNYRSKLLYSIMGRFASTLQKIKSLSNEKGKYMMCPRDCTPTTRFVQRDATFVSPPERKTMRSLVRVSVPVFVPRGHKKARSDASSIVKKAFARAISTGKFNGFS